MREEQEKGINFLHPRLILGSLACLLLGFIMVLLYNYNILSENSKKEVLSAAITPVPSIPPTATPSPTATPTPIPPTDAPTPTLIPLPTANASNDSVWLQLAECESHQHWNDDTGNGYYGGLQFSIGAWESVGGIGKPSDASKDEQIMRGKMLQAHRGWGPWATCSRMLRLY